MQSIDTSCVFVVLSFISDFRLDRSTFSLKLTGGSKTVFRFQLKSTGGKQDALWIFLGGYFALEKGKVLTQEIFC